jgi:hypothetical protein
VNGIFETDVIDGKRHEQNNQSQTADDVNPQIVPFKNLVGECGNGICNQYRYNNPVPSNHDYAPLHQNLCEIGKGDNLKSEHSGQPVALLFDGSNELESEGTHEQNENNHSESSHFFNLPSFTVSKVYHIYWNLSIGFLLFH